MVETPAQLRSWRIEAEATQAVVGEVLGVTPRTVVSWELGEHPMPPLLPWALIAARPHVDSLTRCLRRQRATARKKRERLRRARHQRAKQAAQRAVIREAMMERRRELEQQRRKAKKQREATMRSFERAAAKFGPPDRVERGESIFRTKPTAALASPRKVRRDVGRAHQWRGEPGKRLESEKTQHEA